VLLKSADPPPGATLGDLAASGLVDAHFPWAASALVGNVRVVNLRSRPS
jgi:hypothetical protein